MIRISSAFLIRQFGAVSDTALSEPVTITKNGRDRLVLMPVEEFNRVQSMAGKYEKIMGLVNAGEAEAYDVVKFILDLAEDKGGEAAGETVAPPHETAKTGRKR